MLMTGLGTDIGPEIVKFLVKEEETSERLDQEIQLLLNLRITCKFWKSILDNHKVWQKFTAVLYSSDTKKDSNHWNRFSALSKELRFGSFYSEMLKTITTAVATRIAGRFAEVRRGIEPEFKRPCIQVNAEKANEATFLKLVAICQKQAVQAVCLGADVSLGKLFEFLKAPFLIPYKKK